MSTGSMSRRTGAMPDPIRNPYAAAVAFAALCTLVLGAFVLSGGGAPGIGEPGPPLTAPEHVPVMAAPDASTPSPTPSPSPAPPTATPTETPRPTETPVPTSTPWPTAIPTATATPLPTPEPVFDAAGAGLAGLSAGTWRHSGEILGRSLAPAKGEPWLTAPKPSPKGPFAIEAEIAIDPPAEGACDASYGLVVNAQSVVWGAGVAFPCDREGEPVARISDIVNPADGYAADRIVRQKAAKIDPAGWHTLRLEVRGNDLRLSIDGRLIVKAEDPALGDVDASPPLSVGLFSDGLETQVRRLSIYPIDPTARLIP